MTFQTYCKMCPVTVANLCTLTDMIIYCCQGCLQQQLS